jgi:CheY-specific phosphatase CheX
MDHPLGSFLPLFLDSSRIALSTRYSHPIRDVRGVHGASARDPNARICGITGITAPHLSGTLSIQFPESVLKAMASRSDDLEAQAREMTQLFSEHAKASLNALGHETSLALPTFLSGKNFESLGSPSPNNLLVTEFEFESGTITVLFELGSKTPDLTPPEITSSSQKNRTSDALLEFVKAVRKTMNVQFGTRIEVGAPFKKSTSQTFSFDVGSLIGITEQHFSGFFGMYYEASTFLNLMNMMLGTTFTELSDEIEDGASEVTNICFGVAKQVLNQQGHQIRMALPYLIRGSEIRSSPPPSDRHITIVVPLTTEHGKFWVEFGYLELT